MADSRTPLAYCADQLRAHDPERYVISLFAADEDRGALQGLYAFNLELARVAPLVSEPLLGQIRLQWWRDAIGEIYAGAPRHHEVVLALAAAIRERNLPQAMFETMIAGRATELEAEPPATMANLDAYLRATAGELVALSLRAVGVAEDDPLLDTGRAVGLSSGYLTVAKALQSADGRQRPLLPRDLLARHDVALEDIAGCRSSPGLAKAVEELARRAWDNLTRARAMAGRPMRRHMAPLLAGAFLPSYLGALESADHDPFKANYERGSLARHVRIYRNAVLRRV